MVGVGDPISGRGPVTGVPVVLRAGAQTWRAAPDRAWTTERSDAPITSRAKPQLLAPIFGAQASSLNCTNYLSREHLQ